MMFTPPVTICFIYFKSLALANLRASLYALNKQDMTFVDSIIVLDNDTLDSEEEIQGVIDEMLFAVPVSLISHKHGDESKTHAWSTNMAVAEVLTPLVFFCRADYLLDFDTVKKFVEVVGENNFVVADGYHLVADVAECAETDWQARGTDALRELRGAIMNYGIIDSGVWLARKSAFDAIGGLDERLTLWGHAQTLFQHRMSDSGVQFVRIPEVLFYHPAHTAHRDISEAHRQLETIGITAKDLWKRYEGGNPYASL